MTREQKQELDAALEALSNQLDQMAGKLRVYDTALQMLDSNSKPNADIFRFWMTQAAGLPELQNVTSAEYKSTIQRLRELAVHVFQTSNSPSSTEESQSIRPLLENE